MEDRGGGGRMREGIGRGSGVKVVHNIGGRVSKLKLVDCKGHIIDS